jgi:hypothetical protein
MKFNGLTGALFKNCTVRGEFARGRALRHSVKRVPSHVRHRGGGVRQAPWHVRRRGGVAKKAAWPELRSAFAAPVTAAGAATATGVTPAALCERTPAPVRAHGARAAKQTGVTTVWRERAGAPPQAAGAHPPAAGAHLQGAGAPPQAAGAHQASGGRTPTSRGRAPSQR